MDNSGHENNMNSVPKPPISGLSGPQRCLFVLSNSEALNLLSYLSLEILSYIGTVSAEGLRLHDIELRCL